MPPPPPAACAEEVTSIIILSPNLPSGLRSMLEDVRPNWPTVPPQMHVLVTVGGGNGETEVAWYPPHHHHRCADFFII